MGKRETVVVLGGVAFRPGGLKRGGGDLGGRSYLVLKEPRAYLRGKEGGPGK